MYRPRLALFSIVYFVVSLLMVATDLDAQQITVERASEWDDLFNRTSGWTGADGIYSIPLSGRENAEAPEDETTVFVFSDTFVGEVGPDGQRLGGSTLVNNSLARLTGPQPDEKAIVFGIGGTEQTPDAVFKPSTPNAEPEDWYWLQDGVAVDGRVYIYALRMGTGNGGVFNFATGGVSLISFPAKNLDLSQQTQVDTPLYWLPGDDRGEVYFGAAIMANTAEAGAPVADGYVYIYGTQNDPFIKGLVVCRVLPNQLADFGNYRYWDGSGWSATIEDSVPITDRVSNELSVTPLSDGRFVLVFQVDALGREVGIRIGDSPTGPWGPVVPIWTCPEPSADPNGNVYTYNAKAHPHLSQPGELLISYNVNTFAFLDLFQYAGIYRPRFIRLKVQ